MNRLRPWKVPSWRSTATSASLAACCARSSSSPAPAPGRRSRNRHTWWRLARSNSSCNRRQRLLPGRAVVGQVGQPRVVGCRRDDLRGGRVHSGHGVDPRGSGAAMRTASSGGSRGRPAAAARAGRTGDRRRRPRPARPGSPPRAAGTGARPGRRSAVRCCTRPRAATCGGSCLVGVAAPAGLTPPDRPG